MFLIRGLAWHLYWWWNIYCHRINKQDVLSNWRVVSIIKRLWFKPWMLFENFILRGLDVFEIHPIIQCRIHKFPYLVSYLNPALTDSTDWGFFLTDKLRTSPGFFQPWKLSTRNLQLILYPLRLEVKLTAGKSAWNSWNLWKLLARVVHHSQSVPSSRGGLESSFIRRACHRSYLCLMYDKATLGRSDYIVPQKNSI